MAEIWFERKNDGRRRRGWPRRLLARLLTVVVCFFVAMAADMLTQVGVTTEWHWAVSANQFFITPAHAKKASQSNSGGGSQTSSGGSKQTSSGSGSQTSGSGSQTSSSSGSQTSSSGKSSQSKTNADKPEAKTTDKGKPDAKTADDKDDDDDRSSDSARDVESKRTDTARRTGSGSQAQNTEPPQTVVQALDRMIQWIQPRPETTSPQPLVHGPQAAPPLVRSPQAAPTLVRAPQAAPPVAQGPQPIQPVERSEATSPQPLAQGSQAATPLVRKQAAAPTLVKGPQAAPPLAQGPQPIQPAAKSTQATPQGKVAQETQAEKRRLGPTGAGNALVNPGTYRPNELLVLGATRPVLQKLEARGWPGNAGAAQGVVRLVSDAQDPLLALQQLKSDFPEARFALNFVYTLASDGESSPGAMSGSGRCDPQRCYGPALIEWRADVAACAAGVKIGIIDTAVDVAHPALAWKKLSVRRKRNQDAANIEPHSHGTGVVSLLAGNPNSGTPGLVPEADYVITDVFTKKLGKPETDTEHLLWALDVLEQQGAQVVNMSLSGPRDDVIHQRLAELSLKGMVFVAAAGNDSSSAPAYPAAYKKEVIAVTAVDRDLQVYGRANRGDYIDVAAPGVRIWTALPNNKEGIQSGTSFAAPFVTAIVAAIYRDALLPAMSDPRDLRGSEVVALAHLSTAKIARDETLGRGLVRAPSDCAAGKRHQIPTVKLTPPIEPDGWKTLVHYASQVPARDSSR